MDKVSLLAGWAAFGLLLLLYIPLHLWLAYRKKEAKPVAIRRAEKLSVERMYGIAKNPASSLDELQAVADSLAEHYTMEKENGKESKQLLDIVFILTTHNHADDMFINRMLQKLIAKNPQYGGEFRKAMRR